MISVENVDFAYSKKKDLFKGLQLNLESNKIYGLLGRNGMGKSTLLKLMAGFLAPQNGNIYVDEHAPHLRKVGFIENFFFLNEDFVLPSIRISEYLSAYAGFYPNFDNDMFYSILKEFEVDKEAKIQVLSFGQKKKVLIAFAIATNVKYLFLDEPTNGLDIPSKSQFRKLMAKHFSENQIIIISTHQIRDLSNLLDSVIIIDNGEIILSKDISSIEEKIFFTPHNLEHTTSIYSEMIPGGHIHLYPNSESKESQIEIEAFFNAVVQEKQSILNIINQ